MVLTNKCTSSNGSISLAQRVARCTVIRLALVAAILCTVNPVWGFSSQASVYRFASPTTVLLQNARTSYQKSTFLRSRPLRSNLDPNEGQKKVSVTEQPAISGDSGNTEVEATFDRLLQEMKLERAVQLWRSNPSSIQVGWDESKPVAANRWDKVFASIEERIASADEEEEKEAGYQNANMRAASITEFPAQSRAREAMTNMYRFMQEEGLLQLFGAVRATARDTMHQYNNRHLPAAGTHVIPPTLLEKTLNISMQALTPQPSNSILLAGGAVAVLEILISASTGISLTALTLLTLGVALLDRVIFGGAVSESVLRGFSPAETQSKIIRHEAGHFLLAYLLGCPVEGIVLSAWQAWQDKRFRGRRTGVSAGTSFFDPDLSYQMNISRKITRASIDRYSIIVMAGIAAEADHYGRADGGAGDEMSLISFLTQLNVQQAQQALVDMNTGGGSPALSSQWTADRIKNQARWGALQAILLLREYKPAHEALIHVLEESHRSGKPVALGDCIRAIEQAAEENNLKPFRRPLGYLVEKGGQVEWIENNIEENAMETMVASGAASVPSTFSSLEQLKGYRDQQRLGEAEAKLNVVGKQEPLNGSWKEELNEYRELTEKRLKEVEAKLKALDE